MTRDRVKRPYESRASGNPGAGSPGAILLVVSGRPDVEEEGASRRVRVRLPPWLGGNNILQAVEEAGLKATAVDASTFWWELETKESYEHRSPRLMTIDELAGPSQPPRWETLRAAADPGIPSPVPREQLLAERDRILGERPEDFAACAAALKLVVSTIGHAEMPMRPAKATSPSPRLLMNTALRSFPSSPPNSSTSAQHS